MSCVTSAFTKLGVSMLPALISCCPIYPHVCKVFLPGCVTSPHQISTPLSSSAHLILPPVTLVSSCNSTLGKPEWLIIRFDSSEFQLVAIHDVGQLEIENPVPVRKGPYERRLLF